MVATRPDRLEIKYQLRFKTPFHFGTGVRVGGIDRSVLHDSDGYLYVPGSTFKGVLREHCEQLANFFRAEDPLQNPITSPHDAKAALRGLTQPLTIITRIFGSQMYPGRLFFDDARQDIEDKQQWGEIGEYKDLQVSVLTQVRIDRSTRTAVEKALYTSEFGIRYLTFKGSIRGQLECTPMDETENSPTYSLLLLVAGLMMLERMGGNKSAGKGQCECKIIKLTLNGERSYTENESKLWLEKLKDLEDYTFMEE